MVVGELATPADVVVVGGGPGGYVAALRCAQRGLQVVLVEREAVGGVCLNVGCIPSKALIHTAQLVHDARSAGPWGVHGEVVVNLAETRQAIDGVVAKLTQGVRHLLSAAGVRVVAGTARLSHHDRIAIDNGDHAEHIQFGHLILATGSRPVTLPGLIVDGQRVLDSTGALSLTELPATVAVVGGGYIGLELGTALAKLGAKVTVVEAADQLLPAMSATLLGPLRRRLNTLGVTVMLGAQALGIDDHGLVLRHDGREVSVAAERVIVAVGRRPNSDDLGLALAEVTPLASGHLDVDAARRTANRAVLAIGDLTVGPALAHKAMAEAEVAAATAAGHPAAFDPRVIPAVVFCDPEIVAVGLTYQEAVAEGYDAVSGRFALSGNGRALTTGSPLGFVELVTDRADGTVLGGQAVGPYVSELAGELALAVEMGATAEDLALTIHPHPTVSEAIGEAAWAALGRPLHAPR